MRKLRLITLAAIVGGALVGVSVARRGRTGLVASPVLSPLPAPSPADLGDLCADVGDGRACWLPRDAVGDGGTVRASAGAEGCKGSVCAVPRTVPGDARPPAGWRCDGVGAARVCEERRRNAGGWECDGARCVQRMPRLPDDGEWTCVDLDGVVYCRGGRPAAGVAPSRPDLGWLCGARQDGPAGERVCVDFAPDLPEASDQRLEGASHAVRCRFEYPGGQPERSCAPAVQPRVGDLCTDGRQCPSGASCVRRGDEGRCLPPRPSPACFFDADCGAGGKCRWATCLAAGGR